MLSHITNGITSAVTDTVTAVTDTVTAPINSSSTTNKNIITDTLTGTTSTITDDVSGTLSSLDPTLLLSMTNLLSLAASLLQHLQNILQNPVNFIELSIITPLLRLLRPLIILAISVLLFFIGVAIMLAIIFSPLIIVSSLVWVPTAMVLLFVTAGLLITSVTIVITLAIFLWRPVSLSACRLSALLTSNHTQTLNIFFTPLSPQPHPSLSAAVVTTNVAGERREAQPEEAVFNPSYPSFCPKSFLVHTSFLSSESHLVPRVVSPAFIKRFIKQCSCLLLQRLVQHQPTRYLTSEELSIGKIKFKKPLIWGVTRLLAESGGTIMLRLMFVMHIKY
ncbi:hypothetical protein PIB30_014283 [Stylosanthes scabra]|uniref:Uncharacterized protein n=1 Tax=Stylosanthes scabra TaxID=79078 RepID=A0ABU6V553_9FABA|nr:hypothetical protein [Stylosanthes scabra]